MSKTLFPTFYQHNPTLVAQELLGKHLIRTIGDVELIGMIVETEAYLAENDLASHAIRGRTFATASLYLDGGHAYVHRIHKYHCFDVVTETKDMGGSVLIRAVQPIHGIEIMKKFRKTDNLTELTSGPGKLCLAFDIDKSFDGIDLRNKLSELRICEGVQIPENMILRSERIGISRSTEEKLRFFIKDNAFVSR